MPTPHSIPRTGDEGGFALLAVLLVIVAMTGFLALTQLTSRTELRIGANTYAGTQAYYAAEAGVEKLLAEAKAQMVDGYLTTAKVDAMSKSPPNIPGYSFVEYSADLDTTIVPRSITQGAFAGLISLDQELVVRASVESRSGARGTVELAARTQAIPIYQFAVFYEDDLEILPGPRMDLRGRVHTNAELYTDGNTGLYFWDMVTAAGDLHLERKASTGGGSDGRRNYARRNDGSWVELLKDTHDFGGDDNPATFPSEAQDEAFDGYSEGTWDHRVQTRASGIEPLRLPIPQGQEPYTILEPCTGAESAELAAARFACRADLRIEVLGTVLRTLDGAGNTKTLVNPTAVWFAPNAFYDDREQSSKTGTALNATNANSNRDVIEIDLSKLTMNEYGNGVVYVTADSTPAGLPLAPRDRRQYVVRIRNGDDLKAPLTIATNLPLYVMGDYNDSGSWEPASLVSDAITILSDNWVDAKSGEGSTENKPDDVEIEAAMLSGHSATAGFASPDAGGQFENFPRFLENWSGKTVTLEGSMISLWTSRMTKGAWGCCNYYSPPNRDWNFDTRFQDPENLPPATPVVGHVLRVGFLRRY